MKNSGEFEETYDLIIDILLLGSSFPPGTGERMRLGLYLLLSSSLCLIQTTAREIQEKTVISDNWNVYVGVSNL